MKCQSVFSGKNRKIQWLVLCCICQEEEDKAQTEGHQLFSTIKILIIELFPHENICTRPC